jgi:hypothetical protein
VTRKEGRPAPAPEPAPALTDAAPFKRLLDLNPMLGTTAGLIDRLVHHAAMITLKGKSYRLRQRGLDVTPAAHTRPLHDPA